MNPNWKNVFSSGDAVQVRIAKDVLKNNGIESHIINKKDSVTMAFGEHELHVPNDLAKRAVAVLEEAEILI